MQYIIVHTPPDSRNSNYCAHLLEHVMLHSDDAISDYFHHEENRGSTYTYYTTFAIRDEWDIDKFIVDLLMPPKYDILQYEKRVLSDELTFKNNHQRLVQKISRKLWKSDYRHSESTRSSFQEVCTYHKKYYQKNNIYILQSSLEKSLPIEYNIDISEEMFHLDGEMYKLFSTKSSPLALFLFYHLERLYDACIDANERYSLGKYYVDDTISGEVPGQVWIGYPSVHHELLSSISRSFIGSYSQYILDHWDKHIDSMKEDIDLVTLLEHGFILSESAKKDILRVLSDIYEYLFLKPKHPL